jgi:Family of unknown function (DUF5993)
MIIILPFATALLACVYTLRGQRGAALGWWAATVAVNVAWLFYHATSKLNLGL